MEVRIEPLTILNPLVGVVENVKVSAAVEF
jgi:hypothetical protein